MLLKMKIRLDSGTTLTGFSAIFKRRSLKGLQSSAENPSQTSRSEQPAGGIPRLLKRHSTPNFNTIRVFARKFHLFTMRLRCEAPRVTTGNPPPFTILRFQRFHFQFFPLSNTTNSQSIAWAKSKIRKTHLAFLK